MVKIYSAGRKVVLFLLHNVPYGVIKIIRHREFGWIFSAVFILVFLAWSIDGNISVLFSSIGTMMSLLAGETTRGAVFAGVVGGTVVTIFQLIVPTFGANSLPRYWGRLSRLLARVILVIFIFNISFLVLVIIALFPE